MSQEWDPWPFIWLMVAIGYLPPLVLAGLDRLADWLEARKP